MHKIVSGQRWINDAELQLGLGTIIEVEERTLTLLFQASGETRSYAQQSAPLTRVVFGRGDQVRSRDGLEITVTRVLEYEGLLSYVGNDQHGHEHEIGEILLDDRLQLNRPSERLQSGQIDRDRWFKLRYRSLREFNRLCQSPLRGLTGCRVSLIPHQLYIANEVATRYAPRVLLADEVGLGKTIEAGLILHQQTITERASRILVVVPESLLHQWLVEMLRRFNMHFSIFNEERYDSIIENEPGQNPFHNDQLILCSLDFLSDNQDVLEQAVAGDWDLLVVDEAHHLEWSPEKVSTKYTAVEQLARATAGVLLLTATPEQLGKSGHFARLRLLDPDRFPDFENFVEEEELYQPVAEAIELLFSNKTPGQQLRQQLLEAMTGDNRQALEEFIEQKLRQHGESQGFKTDLIEHLLDRHGTGRVLFRNTRTAVAGFPERKLRAEPLPCPPEYSGQLFSNDQIHSLLTPERLYKGSASTSWGRIDPRVDWLLQKLEELKPLRCLVICANRDTAIELAEILRSRAGLHMAVFHEGMSIIERDRAAAYFADADEGCQALICSEIGSEGRNFQFAHHLVLFDLPLNPDLLEQRIGRLDRIGQTQTIEIHVPYLENSAQAVQFHWLFEGLGAFERPSPAAAVVYQQMRERLLSALSHPDQGREGLIEDSRRAMKKLELEMDKGRDRLLEYNSCRPGEAGSLCRQALEEDHSSTLWEYMESLFDCFGVHSEEHSEGRYILRPAENMLMSFPQLQEEGMTVCYDREVALTHEDVHYLSWDHPMLINAMDMVLGSELGNTSVVAVSHRDLDPGKLFLESVYIMETIARQDLQSSRYLPQSSIRVVVNEQGKDWSNALRHELINTAAEEVDRETAIKIIAMKAEELKDMTLASEEKAQSLAPRLLNKAQAEAAQLLNGEISRLSNLARVNPNVRENEIQYFQDQLGMLERAIDASELRLDAMRIIITT